MTSPGFKPRAKSGDGDFRPSPNPQGPGGPEATVGVGRPQLALSVELPWGCSLLLTSSLPRGTGLNCTLTQSTPWLWPLPSELGAAPATEYLPA